MDWLGYKKKAINWVGKYRFVLIILAVGLILMLIPGYQNEDTQPSIQETQQPEQVDISQELVGILSQIEGVGEVRVMVTIATGQETLYQTDTVITENESRVETILITDSNRGQEGLIRQVNPPEYKGAIIVCKGADKPTVRLAVKESVSSVTGLGADQISVVKMK